MKPRRAARDGRRSGRCGVLGGGGRLGAPPGWASRTGRLRPRGMKGGPLALREKASQRKVPGWLPAGVLRNSSRPSIQPPVRWVRPPGRIRSMRSRTACWFDTGRIGMTTSAASSKVMRAKGPFRRRFCTTAVAARRAEAKGSRLLEPLRSSTTEKAMGYRRAPSEAKKGAPDGALGGPRQVRPCAAHLVGPKPHREYECLAPTRENPWCFSSPINSLGSAPSPIRWRRAV